MSNPDTSLIRSVLTSEVKFLIGVVVFVFGVVTPYFQMKQDIALIQQDVSTINGNHIKHSEQALLEIAELKEEQVETEKQILIILERL